MSFCTSEHPRLVGALSLYCGDRGIAEELAQDALARVVRDWKKVRSLDAPGAWAHRVAMNLANSYFRRRSAEARARNRFQHEHRSEELATLDPADVMTIRAAVSSLPRRQRSALILRYYVDLPVRQVAAAMDCPEGTVKTLTRKAIASLKESLSVDELQEVGDV